MMAENEETLKLSRTLSEHLAASGLTVATAESCTGGGVAAAITALSGSSRYFKGAVVAYANEVKEQVLGVSLATIENYGAVSEQTVCEMTAGVIRVMKTDFAVATSGVAGPTGGTSQKPVGMVWIAAEGRGRRATYLLNEGDRGRAGNIDRAICKALELLLSVIDREEKCADSR